MNGGLDRSTGSGWGGSGHQAPRGQAETRETGRCGSQRSSGNPA